jgi:hypothetical protein
VTEDKFLPFSFPAVSRKQITTAFDGGRLTSDGGVMLFAMAEPVVDKSERCLGGAECLVMALIVSVGTAPFRQLSEAMRKTYARREFFSP